MEGEIKNLTIVWSSIIASLCYCYFVASEIPKGTYRLLSLLPIFSLFTIIPLSLTYAFPTAVTTFFITWLANFKLLLFCFDLGPLSSSNPNPPLSLPLFISISCLPIKIKPKNSQSTKPKKKIPLNLATESLIFSVMIGVIYDYREVMHPNIVLTLYCCLVFLMIDIIVAICSSAARAVIGLELEQPSDEPYVATSLQDFWGKRWNLTVTNLLRHTVYNPARSAFAVVLGGAWAPLPAVVATFAVSGLMHELLFYYVTRATPSWEMTSFFVLHGLCVVVEFVLKRALTDRWQLHWAVSGPLTVGFVMATSFWLFFPPLMRNGADVKVIGEFIAFVEFIKSSLRLPFLVG
ncbi:probable long-chain-alcohol O-fatty-acyltransferase 5 [Cornus florida]|uniref:probable long-chain-alcohol O-fatty-acyltransferase 5 n=1 Tax=Cornus florida TaxID=4283 RepID=UPI0028A1BCFF|nr:probable long-chain-alcohol O-fatty-acyltransferase 5 [Cornus florida]